MFFAFWIRGWIKKAECYYLPPMRTLENNAVWHADETFKACPALLYQNFTTNAAVNNQTVPLVFS